MVAVNAKLRAVSAMPGPRGLPLLGSIHEIDLKAFHQILEGWAADYGKLYRFHMGPRAIVVTSDAETIKRMFRERPDLFRRTRRLANAVSELRFNGLFSAEGDDWRRQRKLVAMALNTAHLSRFSQAAHHHRASVGALGTRGGRGHEHRPVP
ncbi:MAG: cytochrome P450 [Proteobacteria bacterium]|nr:cytochrome P450 [Pseudomonadota bacterium]